MKFLSGPFAAVVIIAVQFASIAQARFYDDGTQPPAPPAPPTEYIVVYKPGLGPANVIETRRWSIGNLNARFRRLNVGNSLGMNVDVVDMSQSPLGPQRAAEVLSKHPQVDYVELDQVVTVQLQMQPSPQSWGLDRVDQRFLPLSTQYQYDDQAGAGTTVYVVDTGVRVENPEFEGRAVWGADFTGEGFTDGNGHGTHCAGTVGSKTHGVAKQASIVAVKVLNSAGSGSWSGVIAGMNWVAGNCTTGMRCVMSMSLGGGYSSAVNSAVQNAYNMGVVPVVAAGNENTNACNKSPASVTAALTIAASDKNDYRASFSNYGQCVDMFAPGVGITSTTTCNGGTADCLGTWSGTSMAAPHVAGIAALVWTKEQATLKTPLQVVSRVKNLGTVGVMRSVPRRTVNLLAYSGL